MTIDTTAVAYRLSEEQRSHAASCLNEYDDVRDEKIAEIRRWLFSGGGTCSCVVYTTDEFLILRFLRACKFKVDATKRKMKNYFNQRENMPEWYSNRDPLLPELQAFFDSGIFLPLRKSDCEGKTVIIIRPYMYNPKIQKMSDLLKTSMMILDTAMRDNVDATIYGIRAIIDVEGISMNHVIQSPPHVLKQLVRAWQDCYPLRIKSFHFVNLQSFFNVGLTIIKRFMAKKLRDRINVHSTNDMLLDFIDAEVLPPEYCGTGESVESLKEHWKKVVQTNTDWLKKEEANDALWSQKNKRECANCENL